MMKILLFILLVSPQLKAQDVWVNSYTTSEGTYIQGHYRTAPNYTVNDNYSTFGNQNPYTGEWGTKPRDASSNPLNLHPYIPAGNIVTPVALPYKPSVYEYRDYELEARIELNNWKSKNLSLYPSQNEVLNELEGKEDSFKALPEDNYSQNYKDYLYEKENPRPLKDFEDDKAKFYTYQTPTANPDERNNLGATVGFLIFTSLLIFVLLIFAIPKTKKYMTFEEALKVKNTYPIPYKANGTHYIIKIVPALIDDYAKFLADFRQQDLSDEDAKKYSTNGKFKVEGLICVAFNVHQLPLT